MTTDICLDTTALIHFEQAGHLDVLGRICSLTGCPFAPVSVIEEWNGHQARDNGAVTGCDWLRAAQADDPADWQIVLDLEKRYPQEERPGPAPKHEHRGEMDVVALSCRFDAVALMEDNTGGKQCQDKNIPHFSMVTLLAAAVAAGELQVKEAWRIHSAVEKSREPYSSILRANKDGWIGFVGAVGMFKTRLGLPGCDLADLLRQPGLDGQLLYAARLALDKYDARQTRRT